MWQVFRDLSMFPHQKHLVMEGVIFNGICMTLNHTAISKHNPWGRVGWGLGGAAAEWAACRCGSEALGPGRAPSLDSTRIWQECSRLSGSTHPVRERGLAYSGGLTSGSELSWEMSEVLLVCVWGEGSSPPPPGWGTVSGCRLAGQGEPPDTAECDESQTQCKWGVRSREHESDLWHGIVLPLNAVFVMFKDC